MLTIFKNRRKFFLCIKSKLKVNLIHIGKTTLKDDFLLIILTYKCIWTKKMMFFSIFFFSAK